MISLTPHCSLSSSNHLRRTSAQKHISTPLTPLQHRRGAEGRQSEPFVPSKAFHSKRGITVCKVAKQSSADVSALEAAEASIIEEEEKYLLQNYGARIPLVFTHGEGSTLYDIKGGAYLDFAAGIAVNALGHSDAGWVEAVVEQAGKLAHVSNLYHTVPHVELAKRLVENSFADRVFFCNSGTEANEGAIKFARRHALSLATAGGMSPEEAATELVSFTRCFHGRTMGALTLTANNKYKDPFMPLLPGVVSAKYGDLESAAAVIKPWQTAAVFVEPVQGEGGVFPAQVEFLRGLRELCDKAGALLVFDEVQCGLGRTGKLWGHEQFGVSPDIMTLAKPLAGGLPIGAIMMTERVARTIQPGDHGSTFAGGPLVTHAAINVFDRVNEEGFLTHVQVRGEQLRGGLRDALQGNPHVKDVRGLGLMVGVELDQAAGPVVKACRDEGLLVITAGAGNVVRLLPPLIVTEEEVNRAVTILVEVLSTLS